MSLSSLRSSLKDLVLACLLWLLQTIVLCQIRASEYLFEHQQGRGYLAKYIGATKAIKKRGKRPSFPTTVAIILAEEWGGPETLDGLAIFIHWAAAAGIKKLQVYENGGHLKATAGLLEGRLNFQQHKQFELKVCGGREEGADPVIDSTIEARCSNGTTAVKQSVNVTLFSEQDGRVPLFAAILAGLKAGGPDSSNLGAPPSLIEQISAASSPDLADQPELVWVFGPVLTLSGFPPWMVRHSEIHAMGLLRQATKKDLHRALQKYCQTSQRFGR